jgi:hypothetical protein
MECAAEYHTNIKSRTKRAVEIPLDRFGRCAEEHSMECAAEFTPTTNIT